MKIFKLTTLLLIFLSVSVYAQKDHMQIADDAYKAGEYGRAISLYKKASVKVKDDSQKAGILFKTASCFRNIGDSKQAEVWFKKAIDVKYPDPVSILYYADAKKMNELYDEAVIEYQKYNKLVPGDPRGVTGAESCELAAKWKNKPTRYKVESMAYFNSMYGEFSPAFAKKDYREVYFSSSRPGAHGEKMNEISGQNFTDVFTSTQDRKGKWSRPTPLNEVVNSPFDEGAVAVNAKVNNLYFTRCKVDKKEDSYCKLCMAKKSGSDWAEVTELTLGGDSVSVGHPALSPDELTLYFVSTLASGEGKNDIWMLTRKSVKEAWGTKPINLGSEINTSGNEVFPYVHKDGTLYFSSDYHLGMGGLDIFKAVKDTKTNKWKVSNLKYPINSAADDFGIAFQGTEEKGFLTSSRSGGKGGDDIYSFILPALKFNLLGLVKDDKTMDVMAGVKVKLAGSDGTMLEFDTEKEGAFEFKLKPNTNYDISVVKEDYLNTTAKETTVGLGEDMDLTLEILMSPIEKPIELPNILYDVGKWDLRPESMVSLDKLVQTLTDNPNITIELGSHTDFRKGSISNVELSQKRAQSVVDYLIEKGIAADRLVAKGYGANKPNFVNVLQGKQYKYLNEGDILSKNFILKLKSNEEREVAHQINRRTEFQVLSTDYNLKQDSQEEKPEEGDIGEEKAEEEKTEE